MTFFDFLIIAASSYLLGSLSFAIIVCKLAMHKDIRNYGSGNAGLTNAYRTMGTGRTALVLVGDILKGVAAILIGATLGGAFGKLIAGIFVILGHVFPVFFGFRGGKGVLVGSVMLVLFDWRMFLVALVIFIIAVATTRWISLGSILGAASFPLTMYFYYQNMMLTVIAVCMAAAVIFMHRSNIKRILAGKENRFTFHVKPAIQDDNTTGGSK